jgi:hypothetical protein
MEYQEELSTLFGKLFTRADWPLALSTWHALDSDRSQRRMLLRAKLKLDDPLLAEIKWLVDNSDYIADQRNIGIHMPLMKYTELDGTFRILPLAMFGNPKAVKMTGRDLVKEYAHYERQIRKMFSYAAALSFALTPKHRRRGRPVLPERPKLTALSPTGRARV